MAIHFSTLKESLNFFKIYFLNCLLLHLIKKIKKMGVKQSKMHHLQRRYKDRLDVLVTKVNPITDDYDILQTRNGNIVLCQHKETKIKYAVKVTLSLLFIMLAYQLILINKKTIKDRKYTIRGLELQWKASCKCERIVKIKDIYHKETKNKKFLQVIFE